MQTAITTLIVPFVVTAPSQSSSSDFVLNLVLDATGGPKLTCTGKYGQNLNVTEPLIRWEGAPDPSSNQTADGEWDVTLGPAGLDCHVSRLPAGTYGEYRFQAVLTNKAAEPVSGHLLPPFTRWCDNPEKGKSYSPQHLVFRPEKNSLPKACIGTIGSVLAWIPYEFHPDIFSVVPIAEGEGYLTASLVYENGGVAQDITLKPGESATFMLHLSGGSGDRNDALQEIFRIRGGYRVDPASYNFSEYNNPQLAWSQDILAGWLNWAWDKDNMDPVTGEYRLVDSLENAKRLFGGYDVFMIWPFWPRAGYDERYQFDHYRDMPGGVAGLKAEIEKAQDRGVRIILSHCIWSETDRDKSQEGHLESYKQLVDMALTLNADGVLMDIMNTTPPEIRQMMREHGRELLPYAEGDSGWAQSQTNLLGRIHNVFKGMPAFNLKRYMLPHHLLLRVCESGNAGRLMRRDFVLSFFNGHGVEINTMFPQSSPSAREEWPILAHALDVLRANRVNFKSTDWEPLVESQDEDVWINRWPAPGKTIYTLCCVNPGGHHGPVLRLRHADVRYIDLWKNRPISVTAEGDDDLLNYDLEGYIPGRMDGTGDYTAGCIGVFDKRIEASLDFERLRISVKEPQGGELLQVWKDTVRPDAEPVVLAATALAELDLYKSFGGHTNEAIVIRLLDAKGQLQDEAVIPEDVIRFFRIDNPERTKSVVPGSPPAGMVRIPGGKFNYRVEHGEGNPTWQACYHTLATYQPGDKSATREVVLPSFWMDRYPVTNAQFAEFVKSSGYQPADAMNFLRHFANGAPPPGKENHPVVYVSYEDAKAYAAWAGKRLPTEEEWVWASGAADGRKWPWGNDLEPNRCNIDAGTTTAVSAFPSGASPSGVEDLVGNVWQYTAPMMDNGRHLLVFLRGGSWYHPPKGTWWVKGGPRELSSHHPLPLFGPGMNRLATVGFRCVMDE